MCVNTCAPNVTQDIFYTLTRSDPCEGTSIRHIVPDISASGALDVQRVVCAPAVDG